LLEWFSLIAVVILFFDWLWRRHLADWWAGLSQDRALTRARRLLEMAYEVGKEKDNTSRLIVNASEALGRLIIGLFLILLAFSMIGSSRVEFLIKHLSTNGDVAATSEWPYKFQRLLEVWPALVIMIIGIFFFQWFLWIFINRINPQSDYEKYMDRAKAQTKALLKKSGIPESEWVVFLSENWPKPDDAESPGDD
jgi:hypothetical protein